MNIKNLTVILAAMTTFIVAPQLTFAQADAKKPDPYTQMLDYSRPGANHELLRPLTGVWKFHDVQRAFVKGTLTRKPIYNGRFYTVEITGGKLSVPIGDGKMIEELYSSQQTEGYDNARQKFVMTSINNHIGSDIQFQTGTYDPATHEFTYYGESELIKGEIKKDKRVLKIIDANHYTETYYEVNDGKPEKVRELDYEKTSD
jgi:hypothetical protein